MGNDNILVSVVMPVYNADKTLRRALDDIIRQTLRDIEIICVDDGSDDCSRTILEDYSKRYANLIFIKQEHGGAARARNRGIELAKGRYLAILDCDDRFEPAMLERLVSRAEKKYADIVICGCDGFRDGSGRSVPMTWALDHSLLPDKDPFSCRDIPKRIFNLSFGWAWDKLFRTAFVRDNGLRFQELDATNDMYFVFAALEKAERISVLSEVLIHQRLGRKESVSETRYRNCSCFCSALSALRDTLVADGVYDELEQSFKNWVVSFSAWQLNSLTAHPDAFMQLYDILHGGVLADFGIEETNELYYLKKNRREYKQCLEIMRSTACEYLYRRWQSGVKTHSRLLLARTVANDGMTELAPRGAALARRAASFGDCLGNYGALYTAKLLFGMAFGHRR